MLPSQRRLDTNLLRPSINAVVRESAGVNSSCTDSSDDAYALANADYSTEGYFLVYEVGKADFALNYTCCKIVPNS